MKTIFKKPRVIITVVVLVALIALAAVIVTMATGDKATFDGIQVATNGRINLRFYYSNVADDVTTAKVLIKDGDGGSEGEEKTFSLRSAANGSKYVEVPLASGQMGCDVSVTPVDAQGTNACATETWSVAEYGKAVLGMSTLSNDHGAIKAILNYGHFASEYFAAGAHGNVANTVVENEGIYGMGTNPVSAWGYILGEGNGPIAKVQSGFEDEYEVVGVNVSLADAVTITLSYKQGGDTKTKKVTNINTAHFMDDYSQELTVLTDDGQTAISVTDATVISCLNGMFAFEEKRNIAAAAYGYYLWTAGKTNDAATCGHITHMELVDENTSQAVCSLCGTRIGNAVSNDVNFYCAPGMLLNRYNASVSGDSKTMLTNIVDDATNGIHTNINLLSYGQFYLTNATTRITAHAEKDADTNAGTPREIAVVDKLNGGVGKYAVMKVAFSKNATWNLKIDTDTGKTVKIGKWMIPNKSGWSGMVNNASTEFGVIVVDLETLGVMDPDAKSVSVMLQLAGTASEGNYINISYFAICDDFKEISSVVNNPAERIHYTNWVNDDEKSRTVNGYCFNGCSAPTTSKVEVDGGEQITVSCATCGNSTSQVVPANLNFYSAPGMMVNLWASSHNPEGASNATLNAFDVITGDDGIKYSRAYNVTAAGWASFYVTNGTKPSGGDNNETAGNSPLENGMGKYLVMKVRSSGMATQLFVVTGKDGAILNALGGANSKATEKWVPATWTTIVLDVSALETTDAETLKVVFKAGYPGNYIDVAYLAVCNNTDQIQQLVGNDKVMWGGDLWKNGTGYESVYANWDALYNAHLKPTETPAE